jgi:hypothetical protein
METKFITRLAVSKVANSRLWILDAPFIVQSKIVGELEIPEDFIFDGNSLPRFMWFVSLPTDYLETGCIHDYLYRFGKDRKVADEVYREFLEFQGAGTFRRDTRYAMLRMFGGAAFKKNQAGVVTLSDGKTADSRSD